MVNSSLEEGQGLLIVAQVAVMLCQVHQDKQDTRRLSLTVLICREYIEKSLVYSSFNDRRGDLSLKCSMIGTITATKQSHILSKIL